MERRVDPWAILTEAFGQLPWQRHPPGRYIGEDYRTELLYRGVTIGIRRHSYRPTSSRGGRVMNKWHWICGFVMTYAPRPLALSLSPTRIGWSRLPTGDPAFEQHFRLAGAPPDILGRAFDADLRRRMLSAPLRPWIYGEGGAFELDVTAIVEGGRGGVHELRAMADVFADVTHRICGQFDGEQGDVMAAYGPEAAATWWTEQEAALAAVEDGRFKLKVLIIMGVVLLCLVITLITAIAIVM
jgi:hypothetical protein